MRRLILMVVFVLGFTAVSFAQQSNPRVTRKVYNPDTTAISEYYGVKWDTTSRVIALDTTASLATNTSRVFVTYKWDTTGNYSGDTSNVGILPDTIETYGDIFRIRVRPVTTPSADTVIIYGDTLDDKNLLVSSYTGKKTDTLAWVTTVNEQWPHAFWAGIDSIKLKVLGGGADSFRVLFQCPNWVMLSDSGNDQFAGVVFGSAIQKKSSGNILQYGPYKAYVNGGLRNVEPGEALTPMSGGILGPLPDIKIQRTPTIYADTVRTVGSATARYVPGISLWDPVVVTPIGRLAAAASDTIGWKAYSKTDSILLLATSVNSTAGTVAATTRDSLYVAAFHNVRVTPIVSVEKKSGWALQYCRTNGTLIDVFINALK